MLPRPLVRLYRTVSPSPLARPARACKSGCLFSVALVVAPDGSLPTLRTRPAVSRLAALRCSDFPLPGLPLRATNGQRPSHPLPRSQKAKTGRRPQKTGGGGGIRTLDTVSRIQHFQCCAFSHSATPPTTNPTATADSHSGTHPDLRRSTHQPAQMDWPDSGAMTGRKLSSRSSQTGGEGGIRTHGTVTRTSVFETDRFSHSRTSPENLFKHPSGSNGTTALPKNHGADRHTFQPEPRPSPAGGG